MSDIEFDSDVESEDFSRRIKKVRRQPVMVVFVIKCGLAKDDKQANTILVICAFIFFFLTGYIFWNSNHSSNEVILQDGTKITIEQYVQGLKSGEYK